MLTESTPKKNWMTVLGAGSVLVLGGLSLTGCSTDTTGPETGTDVEDIQENADEVEEATEEETEDQAEDPVGGDGFEGLYDQTFYDDVESLDGETATVSATVNEIISDNAFTIAGTDDTTVDELLIIHELDQPELEEGLTVGVTGTVYYQFLVEDVETSTGLSLDPGLYVDWETLPYIDATMIDLSVPAEPEDVDDEG